MPSPLRACRRSFTPIICYAASEFNAGANPKCQAATQHLLNYVESNPDVFMGWAWWAAGPWWGSALRILEPKDGQDAPQMRWLEPRLR